MNQILSKSEVDALLSEVAGDEVDSDQDEVKQKKNGTIHHYDLASQYQNIRGQFQTLDIIYDRFVKLFRVSLSNGLRKVAKIGIKSSSALKFEEFKSTLPLPSCINILRLDPLRGSAIMAIEPKLMFSFVDCFFGGNDVTHARVDKEFTQIEIKVVRKVVLAALEDLAKAWEPVYPLRLGYSRTEINPHFVAVVPPSETVVVTTFDVQLEKVSGIFQIAIPHASLEPIKSRLSEKFQWDRPEIDGAWIDNISRQLLLTYVNMKVKLGEANISIDDLVNLEPGDIIQLDKDATVPLEISVEGVTKFKCVPGVLKGQRAVKIVSKA